jgi:hypothetical protein
LRNASLTSQIYQARFSCIPICSSLQFQEVVCYRFSGHQLLIFKTAIMKLQSYLFVICFISTSHYSYSQDKGYYSIGSNKEKLKIAHESTQQDSFVRAEKGYYRMDQHSKKLRKSVGDNDAPYRRTPLVNKGYYSIGNNREKLSRN